MLKWLLPLFVIFLFIRTEAQATEVLLLTIDGATSGDIAAVETQIHALGLSYNTANSSQLDGMSVTELEAYKLIINPGGNSITMGQNISKTATGNVHTAIESGGVSYLGICAGAFMAETGSPNTYKLTPSYFGFYSEGWIHEVNLSLPGGASLPVVYWNGPIVNNFGNVVAKYSNGQPAIAEGYAGKGFVIISGVHPEAPASWSNVTGYTAADAALANPFAQKMIMAALNRSPLSHF